MRIAIAQEDPTVGDLAGNLARLEAAVVAARGQGCQLVVFPELALTGYPPRDILERRAFVRDTWRAVERLALATRDGPTVFVGTVEENRGDEGRHLWNAAAV